MYRLWGYLLSFPKKGGEAEICHFSALIQFFEAIVYENLIFQTGYFFYTLCISLLLVDRFLNMWDFVCADYVHATVNYVSPNQFVLFFFLLFS